MAAAASRSTRKVLSDITECSICLEVYTCPKSLPCVHTFCLKCLQRFGCDSDSGDKMACPLCRSSFTIPQGGFEKLPNNYFIDQLLELKKLSLGESLRASYRHPGKGGGIGSGREGGGGRGTDCEVCPVDTPATATSFCMECSQNLCHPCSQRHVRQRSSKNHIVVTMEEKMNSREVTRIRGSYCEKHEDKQLELYCYDCKFVVCLVCHATKHTGHKCAEIHDSANEFKPKLKSDQSKVSLWIAGEQSEKKRLDDEKNKFLKSVTKNVQKVKQRCSDLKALIDTEAKDLLNELEIVKTQQLKEVGTRCEEIERQLLILESFKNYSEELTSKGSECDISRSANDLLARANELAKSQGTFVNYKLPQVDVTLTLSNVADIRSGRKSLIGKFPFSATGAVAGCAPEKLSPADISRLAADLAQCILKNEFKRAQSLVKDLGCRDRAAIASTKVNNGQAALLLAAITGNVQFVDFLIDECHADIEQYGACEMPDKTIIEVSPLWCAAINDRLDVVRTLTLHGADVNSLSSGDESTRSTPLRTACCCKARIDVLRFLLDNGADINRPNMYGSTPLSNATTSAEVCEFIISRGAQIDLHDIGGRTALYYATKEGFLESVHVLIKRGANVYARNDRGDDIIQTACLYGRSEILEYLLSELKTSVGRAVEAYELLGTHAVIDTQDNALGMKFWKKAMTLRSNCNQKELKAVAMLPQNPLFLHIREPSNMAELSKMESSTDTIHMYALVLRERILGPTHEENLFGLRFCGAVSADNGDYQHCIDLWKYAFRLHHEQHTLINDDNISCLENFCQMFWLMIGKSSKKGPTVSAAKQSGARCSDAVDVLEMIVKKMCDTCTERLHLDKGGGADKLLKVFKLALHLVFILCRLTVNAADTRERDHVVGELVQVKLRPTDGRTFLHLAIDSSTANVSDSYSLPFPSSTVFKLLLQCGANVKESDVKGETPIQFCKRCVSMATDKATCAELTKIQGYI